MMCMVLEKIGEIYFQSRKIAILIKSMTSPFKATIQNEHF